MFTALDILIDRELCMAGRILERPVQGNHLERQAEIDDLRNLQSGKATRNDYRRLEHCEYYYDEYIPATERKVIRNNEEILKAWNELTPAQKNTINSPDSPYFLSRSDEGVFSITKETRIKGQDYEAIDPEYVGSEIITLYFDPAEALRKSRGTPYLEKIVGKGLANSNINAEYIILRNLPVAKISVTYYKEDDQTRASLTHTPFQHRMEGRETEIKIFDEASWYACEKLRHLTRNYNHSHVAKILKTILGDEKLPVARRGILEKAKDFIMYLLP